MFLNLFLLVFISTQAAAHSLLLPIRKGQLMLGTNIMTTLFYFLLAVHTKKLHIVLLLFHLSSIFVSAICQP
jgi:hypothetical protein